jgi:hypothetical protein
MPAIASGVRRRNSPSRKLLVRSVCWRAAKIFGLLAKA